MASSMAPYTSLRTCSVRCTIRNGLRVYECTVIVGFGAVKSGTAAPTELLAQIRFGDFASHIPREVFDDLNVSRVFVARQLTCACGLHHLYRNLAASVRAYNCEADLAPFGIWYTHDGAFGY